MWVENNMYRILYEVKKVFEQKQLVRIVVPFCKHKVKKATFTTNYTKG